ncbi:MAG: hypothetical protein ACKOCM_08265 [Cyanobacteriota bacterium]
MKQSIPWLWLLPVAALLLLPGPAGRLLLDLIGGLTLTILLLPLLAGAAGLILWQVFKRRLRPCPACGFVSTGLDQCPACGTVLVNSGPDAHHPAAAPPVDASQATIDVQAREVSETGRPD